MEKLVNLKTNKTSEENNSNKDDSLNNKTNLADEIMYRTASINWLMDPEDETNVRPFVYLDFDKKFIGFLDDLTKAPAPSKGMSIVNNEMIIEFMNDLTPSTKSRTIMSEICINFMEDKVSRSQIMEVKNLCSKLSNRFLKDNENQQKLFSEQNIEKRRKLLQKTSFYNKDIKWEIQHDDHSCIRPFLQINKEDIGYLDNCEIVKTPDKENILSCDKLASTLVSLAPYSNSHNKKFNMVVDELSLPCRLSQKRLALISEIYNSYTNGFSNEMMNLNSVFKN